MNSALQIAKWFIKWAYQSEGDDYDITNMKLQKLLYFGQANHLAVLARPLFGEEVQAWDHGPVVPETYRAFKSSGWERIAPAVAWEFEWSEVPEDSTAVLTDVWTEYGCYTASKLRELTHAPGSGWSKHFHAGVQNIVIPHEAMQSDAILA